jgi:hypothetical protein
MTKLNSIEATDVIDLASKIRNQDIEGLVYVVRDAFFGTYWRLYRSKASANRYAKANDLELHEIT